MAVKLQSGECWYSKEVQNTQGKKRAILTTFPVIFAGINVLGGITIKAANSWLGYKRSKTMTYAMELCYKHDLLFNQTEGIGKPNCRFSKSKIL